MYLFSRSVAEWNWKWKISTSGPVSSEHSVVLCSTHFYIFFLEQVFVSLDCIGQRKSTEAFLNSLKGIIWSKTLILYCLGFVKEQMRRKFCTVVRSCDCWSVYLKHWHICIYEPAWSCYKTSRGATFLTAFATQNHFERCCAHKCARLVSESLNFSYHGRGKQFWPNSSTHLLSLVRSTPSLIFV